MTPHRVLICGDRNWLDPEPILACLANYPTDTTVIEGEAPGADSLGRRVAERLDMQVLPFPADWKKYGRAAGPIRNRQMLDEGKPTEVHAFHNDIMSSKGTKNMLTQAKAHGIPCYLHTHTGVTEY